MFRCALVGASRLARSGLALDGIRNVQVVAPAVLPALAAAPAQIAFSKGFAAAAAEPAVAPSVAQGVVTQVLRCLISNTTIAALSVCRTTIPHLRQKRT